MRGKHVSTPVEALTEEARSLAGSGVKELILIAQDLSWYGLDIYKRRALPELLEKLADVSGIEWIRLHYAYPADFPRDVIRVMKERPTICNYLDIPFQHASDKVLRMMKRNHDRKQNYELIDFIRREIPDITLRTTLMTGHPGEGEVEFEELRQFVKDVKFDRLGVFTYSEEEDTWAAGNYEDSVPYEVKKQRAAELMDLQQDISKKLNLNKTGRSIKVLIDRKEKDFYIGRSESDSPEVDNEILIPASPRKLHTGKFYTVKITGAEEFDLYGEVE
jgi:ribosomal protein S12 methylthiotransferase